MDGNGDRQVSVRFDGSTRAAGEARHAVEGCIGVDTPQGFVRDALLLTSELVTNAVMHSGGPSEMTAVYDGDMGWLRVEVSDTSSRVPHIRGHPGVDGGQGLRIVDALAARWGTTPSRTGKAVWFELTWT
jgi:hypothetical protein